MTKKKAEEHEKEMTEKPETQATEQAKPEPREPPELADLRKQLEEQKNACLYLRADFENYKRNINKERLEMESRGEDSVLLQIFGLLEMLERAIKVAHDQKIAQAVIDGLELVKREMFLILERFKVSKIPAEGQKFDPKVHEAIAVVDVNDAEPGTVIKEERPGFIRESKVLQPARVIVVKEKAETVH